MCKRAFKGQLPHPVYACIYRTVVLVVKRNTINECINGCGNVALNSLKVNLEKQVVVVDAARERRMNVNYIFLWFEISLPRGTTLTCSRARPDTLINAPTMKQAATRLNVSVSYALFLSLSLSLSLPVCSFI